MNVSSVSPPFNDYRTAVLSFCDAIEQKLPLDRIKPLIEDQFKNDFLIGAFFAERDDVVGYLLEKGADPFLAEDEKERNLLFLCAEMNKIALLELILKHPKIKKYIDHTNHTMGIHNTKTRIEKEQAYTALMVAIEKGHTEVLKRLLQAGCDTRVGKRHEVGPLAWACSMRRVEIVEILIKHIGDHKGEKNCGGIDDSNTEQRSTALHYAVSYNEPAITRLLLAAGANPYILDHSGHTPLYIACCSLFVGCIEALLEEIQRREGAASAKIINAQDGVGDTLLLKVVRKKCGLEIVRLLLKAGGDPSINNKDQLNPFFIACFNGALPIVQEFITFCDAQDKRKVVFMVNIPGPGQETPIFTASQKGHKEIVQLLLKSGANPKSGGKPVSLVDIMYYKHYPVVEVLVRGETYEGQKVCVDVTQIDKRTGVTPLYYAADSGQEGLIRLFLEGGADPNQKTSDGGNGPLIGAVDSQSLPCVQALIKGVKRGEIVVCADVNDVHTPHRITPLGKVAMTGNVAITKAFLEAGADPLKESGGIPLSTIALANNHVEVAWILMNAALVKVGKKEIKREGEFPQGYTSLHFAAEFGISGQLPNLLQHGMDPNLLDCQKRSPLSLACRQRNLKAAHYLIEGGASVNTPAEEERVTPFQIAAKNNDLPLLDLLFSKGADLSAKTRSGLNAFQIACIHGHLRAAYEIYFYDKPHEKIPLGDSSPDQLAHFIVKILADGIEDPMALFYLCCASADSCCIEIPQKEPLRFLAKAALDQAYQLFKQLKVTPEAVNRRLGYILRTPLDIAAREGHVNLIRVLLQAGANPLLFNGQGYNPLLRACLYDQTDAALQLMEGALFDGRQIVADPNQCHPKTGQGPLHAAAFRGNVPLVQALLKRGADPNKRTKAGEVPFKVSHTKKPGAVLKQYTSKSQETPLSMACAGGHLDAARLLIQNGADVNVPVGESNKSLLFRDAMRGNAANIHLLLEAGANPAQTTSEGYSPLYVACSKGHIEAVRAFLQFPDKTLPLLREKNGPRNLCPLEIAEEKGHTVIVQLLRNLSPDLKR